MARRTNKVVCTFKYSDQATRVVSLASVSSREPVLLVSPGAVYRVAYIRNYSRCLILRRVIRIRCLGITVGTVLELTTPVQIW